MDITFVGHLIINGEYYRVIKGGLDVNKLNIFFNSIVYLGLYCNLLLLCNKKSISALFYSFIHLVAKFET